MTYKMPKECEDPPFEFTVWDTGVLVQFAETVEMNAETTENPRQQAVFGRMALHANWELERRQIDYDKFQSALGALSVRTPDETAA